MFGLGKDYYADQIKQMSEERLGITRRTIKFEKCEINIFFINQLTDREMLVEGLIKPLVLHCREEKRIDPETAVEEVIFSDDIKIKTEKDSIIQSVIDGFVVVLFSNSKEYLIVNLKSVEKKSIAN